QGAHARGISADQYGGRPASNEPSGHPAHLVQMTLSPAIFDTDVAAIDEAGLRKAASECIHAVCPFGGRYAVKDADHRHRRLLRARRNRPRCRRAAEKRDELAPAHHSITSSARRTRLSGTVRPIALAALRLMTSSNLVGNSSGRSATLAPRRMRSTKYAARW